jgi:hypothetical protein
LSWCSGIWTGAGQGAKLAYRAVLNVSQREGTKRRQKAVPTES